MDIRSNLSVSLLCAASVIALASTARAQEAADNPETVVVTGSRVISDAANSPTPLTVVTTAQLQATTPSNIPDALNKLPVFQGSAAPRGSGNASTNGAGNVLNLRNFGTQRTLVLLDGHRVAPTNANGTVDIDILPQMLMQRVDVVTGGASAVYGSDAVTGVVNFILDKHFTGLKVDANSGISTFADSASYQAGLAAGSDIFGGRGHIEGSVRHFHEDGVKTQARAYGRAVFEFNGAGTAANPYATISNSRLPAFAFGGKITCTGTTANPCAANGMQFVSNGVLGPFNPGTTTGTSGLNIGGDGTYTTGSQTTAALTTNESFARFSYNIDDSTTAYIQAQAAESVNRGTFQNNYIQNGTVPNVFSKTNPYLPAAAQALLAGGTSTTFLMSEYITDQGLNGGFLNVATQQNISGTAGIDGTMFGKYDWDVFYTHGSSRLKVDNPHNQDNQRMYASEDAVLNSAGNTVCQVSSTTSASLYPGCVPMNAFGPTAMSSQVWSYFTQDTNFVLSQKIDDLGGSISGEVFDLPAGPIKAALSAEYRVLDYQVVSSADPTVKIDCTGLRFCNTGAPRWQGNIAASQAEVSNNVWEFAGEAVVPLLKDIPLIQALDANIAGRYTDYSTSGAVQTWKIGLDYHVNDSIRFRGTTSVDIRAPTLNDLFSPTQVTATGYTDLHTGVNGTTRQITQSNSNLVPEVARTYTGGVVFTPSFVPGLTTSIDYYSITLKNAITTINGFTPAVQQLCEAANGTGPYCVLYTRPLPFSDRTTGNYPTSVIAESLNAAFQSTEGWDIEADYSFEVASIWDAMPGSIDLRVLANIQPYQDTQNFAGAPITFLASSKGRVTSFVTYNVGNWSFNFLDRWLSGFPKLTQAGQIYAVPRISSTDYLDLTINRKFVFEDKTVNGYFSVQNLFNTQPEINPINTANPGLGAGAIGDLIGRYFTIGIRANL